MGDRVTATNINITVKQDGFTLTNNSQQNSDTLSSDGVPLSTVVNLAIGHNTIAVPAKASGVTIVPSQSAANSLVLKGVAGDTGIPIQSVSEPAPYPSASFPFAQGAVASFVLDSQIIIPVTCIWQ